MNSAYTTRKTQIIVCGQRFVVRQANTMDASYRYFLINEAVNEWEAERAKKELPEKEVDILKLAMLKNIKTILYPTVIVVTESLDLPIPVVEEFINMPNEEQEKWLQAVKELNPHFFPDETEDEEQVEKKN